MHIQVLDPCPDDPAWDNFLAAHPAGQHLQSNGWGQLKARFGWQVLRIVAQEGQQIVGGAQILTRSLPVWGRIAYIPKGPVVAPGRADVMEQLYDTIEQVAHAKQYLLLSIQPPVAEPVYLTPLRTRNFKPSHFDLTPSTTVLVDLAQSDDEILAQMRRSTRYNVRLASRKGVQVRERNQDDLPLLYRWMEETAARDPYRYYSLAYYQEAWQQFAPRGMLKLFMAYYDDEPVAGMIVLAIGHWAVYKWGAASGQRREYKPNELLQWAAMQWSKAQGCRYYDLGGITPSVAQALIQDQELPDVKGTRIASFKAGFGQIVTFPDPYDNIYIIRPRWLMRQAVSLAWKFKALRRLAQGTVALL